MLTAGPAAALLACCSWNNDKWDHSGDWGHCDFPMWVGGTPVLADGQSTIDTIVDSANLPTQQKMDEAEGKKTDSGATGEGRREEGGAVVVMAKAKARAEAALRAARLVWTAVVISADYKAFDVSQVLVLWMRGYCWVGLFTFDTIGYEPVFDPYCTNNAGVGS